MQKTFLTLAATSLVLLATAGSASAQDRVAQQSGGLDLIVAVPVDGDSATGKPKKPKPKPKPPEPAPQPSGGSGSHDYYLKIDQVDGESSP